MPCGSMGALLSQGVSGFIRRETQGGKEFGLCEMARELMATRKGQSAMVVTVTGLILAGL